MSVCSLKLKNKLGVCVCVLVLNLGKLVFCYIPLAGNSDFYSRNSIETDLILWKELTKTKSSLF